MNTLVAHKRILTVMNVLVVSGLIFLYHVGFLDSVTWGSFALLSISIFILALYRPMIVFVLFIGTIPLEIINIAPDYLTSALRPYQFFGAILFSAAIVRHLFGISKQKLLTWGFFDILISLFVGMSFLNLAFVNDVSVALKQSIVLLSFGLLYFVVRFFVRSKNDVLALFPIMISSGVVVGMYAIAQNILFMTGGNHQEVMPGRPNATFVEPDWLGIYIVFMIAISLAYLYYNAYHKHLWKFFDYALYGATTIFFVTLIITVARSAWIGMIAIFIVYSLILFFGKKYKLFAMHMFWVVSIGVLSLLIVWGFHLTNFELDNRATSTGTGLQEITIACTCSGQTCLSSTTVIEDVTELEQYNCRHINLEEIDIEKAQGNTVIKIYRKDPNVVARADVYEKTIIAIKAQPLTGYGWGSSGELLGTDENGTPLNTSNIFLEVAVSVGIIGVIIFVAIFTTIIVFAIRTLRTSSNTMSKGVAIFAILGTVAIIVPNLFNAGLFLGFVWMFFGMVAILRKV